MSYKYKKLNISERLNILRSNNKILDEIIPSLRTKEVNLNLYVDANHLKVSIDYGLPEIQGNCQKIWDYFNKG